jgi:integrase
MTGNVHKRGNRWYVTVEMPRDPVTGRRRQKTHSGFRTRKEAEAARVRILADMQRGEYVEPSKRTVGQFLDEWTKSTRATVRPSTWATNKALIDKHVVPRLGSLLLQQVTPAQLNSFYADLQGSGGLAPSSVVRVHAVVRKALSDAVRWGMVLRNVADSANPPRVATAPRRTWTPEQASKFLAHVRDDGLYCAYRLAITTGMRRGEIVGLRWQDVDLEAARLSVTRALVVVSGYRVEESEPKTARGRRNIALDPATVEALRERWLAVPGEHVFPDVHPDALSAAFERHAKNAHLPRISFHDLRHTYATMALQAGIHPKVVSERLGHASVAFTLDTYSHAVPALQESAASLVANLLGS